MKHAISITKRPALAENSEPERPEFTVTVLGPLMLLFPLSLLSKAAKG